MLEVLWSSMPSIDVKTSLRLFDDKFLYIPNKSLVLRPKFGPNICMDSQINSSIFEAKSSIPRPRSIKFLPQYLSTDSKDMDSPDEDELIKSRYTCPPPLIDKQLSVDTIEDFSESTEKEEPPNESQIDNKWKTRIDIQRDNTSNWLSHVHCNGDYNEYRNKEEHWVCPTGLARSVSYETLSQNKDVMESSNDRSPVNTCSTKSSSCSSLVMLSKEFSSLAASVSLLSPDQLGSNDAFMLFLCLTILLQNRDKIIANNLDDNDIQMHFDGLVRKNDVKSVLDFARHLFHSYLSHWHHDYHSHSHSHSSTL